MKSTNMIVFIVLAALLAFSVNALAFGPSRIGVHAAYSAGGDVEDEQFGFGAQLEFALSQNLFVELSATGFSDEWSEGSIKMEADIMTFGASAILRAPIADTVYMYGLGGINYNTIDMDLRLDRDGLPTDAEVRANIDVDDEFGFHVGAGINVEITPNVEIFGEYRYTFLSVDTETNIKVTGRGIDWSESETEKVDYDFGLFKAGLNFKF